VYIKNDCAGAVLRNNHFLNNGTTRHSVRGHGVYWQATSGDFINNVASYNKGWGLQVSAVTGTPVAGVRIYNNTMTHNGSTGTAGQAGVVQGAGFNYTSADGTGQANDNLLYNNILAHNTRWAIQLFDAEGTGNLVDNNVSFDNPEGNVSPTNPGGAMVLSPTNWRAGNPNLVDPANGNFRVSAGSSAIDVGTTLTEANPDAQGLVRPQGAAYDIGAFEFIPSLRPSGLLLKGAP
jgi:hypothetical protein